MHALPLALAGVAEKAGASLRFSTRVERVEGGPEGVTGVVLAGGERLATRDVVVTSDLPAAYADLLPPAARDWRVQRRRLHLLALVLPRPPGADPPSWTARPTTPSTWAATGRPPSRP